MTDERWKQRISIEPDIEAASAAATRARKLALKRLDEAGPSRSPPRWPAAAMVAVTLLLGIVFAIAPERSEAPVQQSSKAQFVLSDGTKVQWVFNDRFAL